MGGMWQGRVGPAPHRQPLFGASKKGERLQKGGQPKHGSGPASGLPRAHPGPQWPGARSRLTAFYLFLNESFYKKI
jgi:hypothetical protein